MHKETFFPFYFMSTPLQRKVIFKLAQNINIFNLMPYQVQCNKLNQALLKIPFPCGPHVYCRLYRLGRANHWSQKAPQQHRHRSHGKRRCTSPQNKAHSPLLSCHCCEGGYSSSISESTRKL